MEPCTFTWNMNGTLGRWIDPSVNYDRVFSYDYEGRLTKIDQETSSSTTPILDLFFSDGVKTRIVDYGHQMEFRLGCAIDCSGTPLRTLGRPLETTDEWHSFDDWLLSPDGSLIARHWSPLIEMEEPILDEQIYIHSDMFGTPLLTNQSGNVISQRGSSAEHCETLKDKLYAMKPGACKQPTRCLSPLDCKAFNNLLYSFCYECQNSNDFRLECDALSNWYYTQSGCKGLGVILPWPNRPFLPPLYPGIPVAPFPVPRTLVPKPPSGQEFVSASKYGTRPMFEDDPAACARRHNGLTMGQYGDLACNACCEASRMVNFWPLSKELRCKDVCRVFSPGSWRR